MRIKYLKLVNYKRLPLRDDPVLECTFDEKLTMLSGPNGSGKSSVFNELTPLPSDSKDFNKNGYKEIHIEHRGINYVLISDFRKGSSYSFLVDGEEENTAGLVTAQRMLAERHFNITQITHDLFVGKANFTDMSLVNRKKLFNAITHLNIDRVINFFNEKSIELRDKQNALKFQYTLLKAEENKLLDKGREAELEEILSNTRKYIDYLYEFSTELSKYKSEGDIESIIDDIQSLRDQYTEAIYSQYTSMTTTDLRDLDTLRARCNTYIKDNLDYQLDKYYDELEEINGTIDKYAEVSDADHEEVISERNYVVKQIDKLTKELRYLTETDNLQEMQQTLLLITSELPDICNELPINERYEDGSYQYGRDSGLRVSDNIRSVTEKMRVIEAKIVTAEDKLKHLNTHVDNVTCPQCKYEWSPTNREDQLKITQEELSNLYSQQKENKEKVTSLNEELELQRSVFDLYRRYYNLRNSSLLMFRDIWNKIDNESILYDNPKEVPYLFEVVSNDIRLHAAIDASKKRLEQLEFKIKVLQDSKEKSLSTIHDRKMAVEQNIRDLQLEKAHQHSELLKIDNLQRNRDKLLLIGDSLRTQHNALRASFLNKVVTDLLHEISIEMASQKAYMLSTETELREQQNVRYTIEQYKKTIETIQEEVKVLKIVTDELSPKNGLIARSVSSFLNMIILNVNNTIRSIWDYKMELLPIDVNTDALNYKFKVNVEDRLTIDDIDTVSKGMSEIINLSFKLVLYKLLRIDLPPLFLDELGSHLDKHHTDKIVWLINQLTMNDEYSQIFLISHKENFGFIKDIDVIELVS